MFQNPIDAHFCSFEISVSPNSFRRFLFYCVTRISYLYGQSWTLYMLPTVVHVNKYIRMRFSLICLLGVAICSLARASSEEHLSEILSRLEKLENENKIKDEKITYLLEKTKYCPQGGIEGQTQISPRKSKFFISCIPRNSVMML